MSIQSKINFIHELDDSEKIAATLKIIMESENEDIIERANELWMMLVLVHGDLLSDEFKRIETNRNQQESMVEIMQKMMETQMTKDKTDSFKEDKTQWPWPNDLYNKDPKGWI